MVLTAVIVWSIDFGNANIVTLYTRNTLNSAWTRDYLQLHTAYMCEEISQSLFDEHNIRIATDYVR